MANPPNVITVPAKAREFEVPLSLRAAGELVAKHKGEQHDAELDELVATAEEITKVADKVQSSCTTLLANKMQTELRNTADAKVTASKLFQRIAPRLDGARKRAE